MLSGFLTSVTCLAFQVRPTYCQGTKSAAFELEGRALELGGSMLGAEEIAGGEGGRLETGEGLTECAHEEYALSWQLSWPSSNSEALRFCPDNILAEPGKFSVGVNPVSDGGCESVLIPLPALSVKAEYISENGACVQLCGIGREAECSGIVRPTEVAELVAASFLSS